MVEPVVLEKDSFKLKEIEKNQIQNSILYDKKFFQQEMKELALLLKKYYPLF